MNAMYQYTAYVVVSMFMNGWGVLVDVRYESHACELAEMKWRNDNV